MAEQDLAVDLSTLAGPVNVFASLGELTDATGNVVTDTIASASYTLTDATLASITSQDGVGNAEFALALVDGVETVNVSATTGSAATVTGAATITITGAESKDTATNVAVQLSLTAPATPPAPIPPVVPTAAEVAAAPAPIPEQNPNPPTI